MLEYPYPQQGWPGPAYSLTTCTPPIAKLHGPPSSHLAATQGTIFQTRGEVPGYWPTRDREKQRAWLSGPKINNILVAGPVEIAMANRMVVPGAMDMLVKAHMAAHFCCAPKACLWEMARNRYCPVSYSEST